MPNERALTDILLRVCVVSFHETSRRYMSSEHDTDKALSQGRCATDNSYHKALT